MQVKVAAIQMVSTPEVAENLAEAERLGGNRQRLEEAANGERTTQWMKDTLKIGESLGFVATCPTLTSPVRPSNETKSPSLIVCPFTRQTF